MSLRKMQQLIGLVFIGLSFHLSTDVIHATETWWITPLNLALVGLLLLLAKSEK